MAAGVSGPELSKLAGIAPQHLYKMELETGVSTLPVAQRLADGLNITLEQLFGQQTGPAEYPPKVVGLIEEGVHPVRAFRTYYGVDPGQMSDECRISLQHLSNLEHARRLCSPDVMLRIASLSRISADRLIKDVLARHNPDPSTAGRLPIPAPATIFTTQMRVHFESVLAPKPENCQEMADLLNMRGLTTRRGRLWQVNTVRETIKILGLEPPRRRLVRGSENAEGEEQVSVGSDKVSTRPAELAGTGERLRQLRQQKGMTAKELGARSGIYPSYISAIETKRGF